jgi:hemolysin activation/secretion protein
MNRGMTVTGRLLAVFAAVLPAVAAAQVHLPAVVDPGVLQQQSEQQRQRMEKELGPTPQHPSQPLDTKGLEKPEAAALPAIRFRLVRVEFSPSQILDKASLDAIAAEYQGREVGFGDLQALVAKVNALYRAKGAVAAEAVIPPQDVSGGVVKIRLVEGRIGRYGVEGNATTRQSYVVDRMHEPPGVLLDTRRLEQDLIRFNRTNDAQLRAELTAGEQFGTTDVQLKLAEPQRNSLRVFGDNAGSPSTGEDRAGVIYENRSLFGFRDDLMLSYTGAAGYTGQSINYAFPVNTWGGRLQLGYEDDRTKIISGAFEPLDVAGSATAWSGQLRQPVFLDADRQLDATFAAYSRRSVSHIGSVELVAIDALDTVAGMDYQGVDASGSWAAGINITAGDSFSSTHSRLGYLLWRWSVRRDQTLPHGFSGRFNLAVQDSNNDQLPSTAQYFIGGAGSVRGYSTAAYGGARGYAGNLELRHVLLAGDHPNVTGMLFFDHGEARPTGPGQVPVRLASIGLGAEFSLARGIWGQFTFGHQLLGRREEPRNYRVDATLVAEVF